MNFNKEDSCLESFTPSSIQRFFGRIVCDMYSCYEGCIYTAAFTIKQFEMTALPYDPIVSLVDWRLVPVFAAGGLLVSNARFVETQELVRPSLQGTSACGAGPS